MIIFNLRIKDAEKSGILIALSTDIQSLTNHAAVRPFGTVCALEGGIPGCAEPGKGIMGGGVAALGRGEREGPDGDELLRSKGDGYVGRVRSGALQGNAERSPTPMIPFPGGAE